MVPDNSHSTNLSIEELLESFFSSNSRKRRALLPSVEKRFKEISELGIKGLKLFDPESDDWAMGWVLQVLQRHDPEYLQELLNSSSEIWFATPSDIGIDYEVFQRSLLQEDFEQADRFTSSTLRKLAGPEAVKRGYVYFSEVPSMAGQDLITLDRMWVAYSQGKFGFSIQGKLLNSFGKRYEKLWPRIGWKVDGTWTRYPSSFDWSLKAPDGHMPLVNQLRGVRLMDSLLNHPSLKSRI